MAAISSQIKPNQIGKHRAERGSAYARKPIDLPSTGQSARRQQPGCGGQRNAHLFYKDRGEQNRSTVPNQKLKGFIHGL